jgi:hypothetical protein
MTLEMEVMGSFEMLNAASFYSTGHAWFHSLMNQGYFPFLCGLSYCNKNKWATRKFGA